MNRALLRSEIVEQTRDILEMVERLETAEEAHQLSDSAVELAAVALRLRAELMRRPRPQQRQRVATMLEMSLQ